MRGVYRVSASIATVTAAKPLLYIATPAGRMIEILSASVTCENEDTSEQIKVRLARATGTVAGGDVVTPKPTEEGDQASACTAKSGGTAITGMTSDVVGLAIAHGGSNKLGGWFYDPLPEERAIITISDFLILDTIDAIANSCTLAAEIMYREIG